MSTTPTLRRDLNMGSTWLLPAWSTAPVGDERAVLEGARAAGYQGIQGANPELCRELGLVPTTFDIRIEVGGMLEQAKRFVDQGFACATLMVGTGLESDDDSTRLMEEIVAASAGARIPLYVETHRATATQDIWRTLRLVERLPELRFNGDFSHWYTAHDLPIGDFAAKLDLMAPVFERVRYMHGRIGTSGCIQVDIGDGNSQEAPHSITSGRCGSVPVPVSSPAQRTMLCRHQTSNWASPLSCCPTSSVTPSRRRTPKACLTNSVTAGNRRLSSLTSHRNASALRQREAQTCSGSQDLPRQPAGVLAVDEQRFAVHDHCPITAGAEHQSSGSGGEVA